MNNEPLVKIQWLSKIDERVWTRSFNLKKITAIGWTLWLCWCLFAAYLYSQDFVRLILKVYVNSEDKGEYFLFLTPEGDVMFSYGDIRALGFKSLPQRKE
jgi:hypothetical protein